MEREIEPSGGERGEERPRMNRYSVITASRGSFYEWEVHCAGCPAIGGRFGGRGYKVRIVTVQGRTVSEILPTVDIWTVRGRIMPCARE